jgi:hypothetical protein
MAAKVLDRQNSAFGRGEPPSTFALWRVLGRLRDESVDSFLQGFDARIILTGSCRPKPAGRGGYPISIGKAFFDATE